MSPALVISQFIFIFRPDEGHRVNLELKSFCSSFPKEKKRRGKFWVFLFCFVFFFKVGEGVQSREVMISSFKKDSKENWPHFIGRRLH